MKFVPGLVFLPGLVRGVHEIIRSPVVYVGTTQDFTIKKKSRLRREDVLEMYCLLSPRYLIIKNQPSKRYRSKIQCRNILNILPERLNFGLDVLPRLSVPVPDAQVGIGPPGASDFCCARVLMACCGLAAALVGIMLYPFIMAVWFPFLPVVQ